MYRRQFLTSGTVALGGLLLPRALAAPGAGAAGEHLLSHVGAPHNLGTPMEYLDRLVTPTRAFFVRSHFGVPAFDALRPLRVSGLVERLLLLGPRELRDLPEVTITAVLQCAGNGRALHRPRVPGVQWLHGAMGQASWTGVRLGDLLRRAGVRPGAAYVRLVGADLPPRPTVPSFHRGIELEHALNGATLVAYRMNGEPLTSAHGGPLRLVVPGWVGDHWVKWLHEVRVQREAVEGFYTQVAYCMPRAAVAPGTAAPPAQTVPLTTFPVKSIIARPSDGGRASVGPQEVVGVAFCGTAAIRQVEVSVDGGRAWSRAALQGPPGAGVWQVFRHRFVAKNPGVYEALVRATDNAGATQPEEGVWNPSGYVWNGWHRVRWTVS